ncbi:hypothetical protein NLG97_g2626 [Lecanicillium saksenae]|uniref:Uncharacterized protein n=1 Tax=Lecanicillium saksenae TaxID=468837 RepID=A0ACC1R3S1_9HYPO|nr:hypothetical protein NLG97_g2626 [Lecanicillium saksenae]
MTRQFSENDPNQHVSPVSALSPQTHFDSRDRDANAPEVVDVAMTPSTFVASPATDYSHPRTATSSHADGTDEGAKEAVKYDNTEKIAVPVANEYQNSPYPQVIGDYTPGQKQDADAERNVGAPASSTADQPPAKIMGLKRRTFFIILIIVCIIIAVAIGGGVGGALGSKKSHSPATEPSATRLVVMDKTYKVIKATAKSRSTSSSASGAATASSTTGTPTTTESSSTKSSTSSAPSSTATFLNQTNTDSGHFFQGFSEVNMTGEYTDIISEVEGADFKFDVHSYEWIAKNTNCCLSFCHNATEEGWAGYVCESKKQNKSSGGFSRVFVWCNNKHTNDVARGRCAE